MTNYCTNTIVNDYKEFGNSVSTPYMGFLISSGFSGIGSTANGISVYLSKPTGQTASGTVTAYHRTNSAVVTTLGSITAADVTTNPWDFEMFDISGSNTVTIAENDTFYLHFNDIGKLAWATTSTAVSGLDSVEGTSLPPNTSVGANLIGCVGQSSPPSTGGTFIPPPIAWVNV